MKKYELSNRGFRGYHFKDKSNRLCSIQESSSAKPSIWLGIDNIIPQLYLPELDRTKTRWVDYPLPESVKIFGRMELTQSQVKQLLPYLQYFAETGKLPTKEDLRAFKTI